MYMTLNMETAPHSLMGNVIRIEVSFLDHILYEYYETHSYTCTITHILKTLIHQSVTDFLSCDHQLSILCNT